MVEAGCLRVAASLWQAEEGADRHSAVHRQRDHERVCATVLGRGKAKDAGGVIWQATMAAGGSRMP